jgi:hypothetical protein
MNTDNKEYKMVEHQEEPVDSEIFLISSVEEVEEILDLKKQNLNLLKSKLH